MKVLYDYQAFIQRIGGVSRYHCELLSKMPLCGVVPMLPNVFSDNIYLDDIGIKHRRFLETWDCALRQKAYKWIDQKLCIQALHNDEYDIFHPTFVNPYYINHVKGKPIVVTVHDLIHEKLERFDSDVVRKKRRRQLEQVDAVIAISEETKNDLLEYYGDIVDETKITIIYHGANQNLANCTESSMIDGPYLMYIGTRDNYKNFETLARAMTHIPKDVRLVCTGLPFSDMEENMLRDLNVRERIWQKFVTDEEMQNLLCHAIAFVYPSLMEGFGLPILESFRCGCPCIISDIGCFREVADDAAVYFSPGSVEAMAEIINNVVCSSDLQSLLKQRGYERLKRFTWKNTVNQTYEVYKKML